MIDSWWAPRTATPGNGDREMGTNYYLFMRGKVHKKDVEKYFPYEYELVDEPDFGYLVHIGKRSCGWKPLFQEHAHAYTGVKGLLQLIDEHLTWELLDEYDQAFTKDGLIEELIDWGECQCEKRGTRHLRFVSGFREFEEVPEGEPYDILAPIDHVEYMRKSPRGWHSDSIRYWHDEDGYDFTNGDFV